MKQSRRGFTFIELLVSLIIMSFILAILSGIYPESYRGRKMLSDRMLTVRTGSAVVDLIRNDLNRMAFYPRRRSLFFEIIPDRDAWGNRRDEFSFDALIPVRREDGQMIYRFGRITYYAEEEGITSDFKKIMRKTVFINDTYESRGKGDADEDDAPPLPLEEDMNGPGEETGEMGDSIGAETDERILVIATGIIRFAIDTPDEETDEWTDNSVENRVPRTLRITIGIAETDTYSRDRSFPSEITEREFSTVFLPILAPYAQNLIAGREEKDKQDKATERMRK